MNQADSRSLDKPIRCSVTSETANIARIRALVADAARQAGFSESDVSSVALAIDEAVANVIKHGYQGQAGQPIDVTIEHVTRADRAGLQVTIRDACPPVAPEEIVGRDLHDVKPGGLGTHIIKTIMDEVEYTPLEPEGMQLRLLKLVADSSAAS